MAWESTDWLGKRLGNENAIVCSFKNIKAW